jgi:DNA-directed RNA polymerase subunit RPC12/RpoP
MAEINGMHLPFGIAIKITGDLEISDLLRLNKWLYSPKKLSAPIFVDIGDIGSSAEETTNELIEQFVQVVEAERSITLIRASDGIQSAIASRGIELPIMNSDSMEEATFPYKKRPRSKELETVKQESKSAECPSCGHMLRKNAYKCLQCGLKIKPRRSERASVSIPFFYGRIRNKEFLQSEWIGSVTEDLDVKTFSGVGFFTKRALKQDAEIHFIFPTLMWESQGGVESTVVVFTGRVKNSTPVGDWYRIGVALIDMFEYSGKFKIQEMGA